jgi:hypothetical protein
MQQVTEDWAVIVGIQYYPGLVTQIGDDGLKGPVSDALEFRKWVTDPGPLGGRVPEKNVLTFLQENIPASGATAELPTVEGIENAEPSLSTIQKGFNTLNIAALKNSQKMLGEKAGRRLYIYLAGHGIEPNTGGPALLLANASVTNFVRHILARAYAEWYYHAAYFNELILFMDCCRDNTFSTPPMPIDRPPKFANILGVKHFYAFGTKWDRRSRECSINGKIHGIFTMTLLNGLRGAASDPFNGNNITVGSLKDYLRYGMKEVACDQVDSMAPQQPDFEPDDVDFVISSGVEPTLYLVTLQAPMPALGKTIIIRSTNGKTAPKTFSAVAGTPSISLQLPRGLFWGEYVGAGGDIITTNGFEVPAKNAVPL